MAGSSDSADPADDAIFMERAIALSRAAVGSNSLRPFGAVIVRDGVVIAEGVNQSLSSFDPTSHGEIEAIRRACETLQSLSLKGCTIYTSCEPCAMCMAVIFIAELDAVVFGADLEASKRISARYPNAGRAIPITSQKLREEVGKPMQARAIASRQVHAAEAAEVLERFAAQNDAGGPP